MNMNVHMSPQQAVQNMFKADGVRELNAPIHKAAEATRDNAMDEIIFSVNGKDYMAFGDKLNFDAVDGLEMLSLKREGIEIHYHNDESNSMGEGVSSALNSTAGKVTKYGLTGLGGLAGAGLGLLAGGMASRPQFIGMGSFLAVTALGAGIGAAAGYGSTAAVGAVVGAVRSGDMSTIDAVTQK